MNPSSFVPLATAALIASAPFHAVQATPPPAERSTTSSYSCALIIGGIHFYDKRYQGKLPKHTVEVNLLPVVGYWCAYG